MDGKGTQEYSRDMNRDKLPVFIVSFVSLGVLLLTSTVSAQEVAAFHIPEQPRCFLFSFPPNNPMSFPNQSTNGVLGTQTILASHFTTTNKSGFISITFYDALVCQANLRNGDNVGSLVMKVDNLTIVYPAHTQVLVYGAFRPLSELTEGSFQPHMTLSETYTGEEAIRQMKKMGLEQPKDIDWEKATNK